MRLRQRERGTVTLWGRLVVLVVFAAGFFTMHGFLAVSASADTHTTEQHAVASDLRTQAQGVAAGADAPGPRASGTLAVDVAAAEWAAAGAGPAPGHPEPAEHHDLVAGCVVALVGVALAGLGLLSQRRCGTAADRGALVSTLVQAIGPLAARWSPPRVALCVIRV